MLFNAHHDAVPFMLPEFVPGASWLARIDTSFRTRAEPEKSTPAHGAIRCRDARSCCCSDRSAAREIPSSHAVRGGTRGEVSPVFGCGPPAPAAWSSK